MPDNNLKDVLGQFNEGDLTVKLCSGIFSVVPGGPDFVFYNDLKGANNRLAGGDPDVYERAKELSKSDEMKSAIWVADALDTADAGISIYTGVKNLFSLFGSKSEAKRTFEADPQQATDAALKAAGLAYMIYKMYPGGIGEKISLYRETPAGQELALYYGVAEVALPFTDNLVEGGADLVEKLMKSKDGDITSKLGSMGNIGAAGLGQAKEVMGQFTGPLGGYVDQAKGHTGAIMEKVKGYLPSAATVANVADSATGAVATGVDLMPVWRFLGGRVVAEACVLRAQKGI